MRYCKISLHISSGSSSLSNAGRFLTHPVELLKGLLFNTFSFSSSAKDSALQIQIFTVLLAVSTARNFEGILCFLSASSCSFLCFLRADLDL